MNIGTTTLTPPAPAIDPASGRAAAKGWALRAVVAGCLIGLLLAATLTTPAFATADNVLVILRSSSLIGLVACGVTLITLSGNFFTLSSGAIAAISGVLFVDLMNGGHGLAISMIATLAVGALLSVLQAIPIALGANPIVTTLAGGLLIISAAEWTTVGRPQALVGSAGQFLGSGRPLGIPVQVFAFVVVAALLSWFVSKTRLGRQILLYGSNRRAAVAVGVRPGIICAVTFGVAGLAAAFVGMLMILQNRINDVTGFGSFDLEILAAIVIGGTAMEGGRGAPWRTLVGAILIAALQNWLVIRGYSAGVQQLLSGVLIVLGVAVITLATRRRSR